MKEQLNQDVITIIVDYIPIHECIRLVRVSSSWKQAIRSLQNKWKDFLINFLNVEKIYTSLDLCIAEYYHHHQGQEYKTMNIPRNNHDGDEINFLDLVKFQLAKLPRKIKSGIKGVLEEDFKVKTLDQSHFGNVDLVTEWSSPFNEDPKTIDVGPVILPHSVSYYEFPFDLYKEIEKLDKDKAMEKLKSIFTMCLVYELLSVGDYVPNLFNDSVMVDFYSKLDEIRLDSYAIKESFASILLCLLRDNFTEIFKNWFKKEALQKIKPTDQMFETSYYPVYGLAPSLSITAENVIQSIETEGFESLNVRPNIKPNSDLKWLGFSDIESIHQDMQIVSTVNNTFEGHLKTDEYEHSLFPLYYNAGGGSWDFVSVHFTIDPNDGRMIKLIREESRVYY